MCDKIAAMASHRVHPDFVLIARTDARHVTGFEDAVRRANLYRAAGADCIFPEGLQSEDEFARFAQECPGPLLANMTEFGKTPDITASRFAELGYSIVIHPLSMMRLAMGHVAKGLAALKRDGTVRAVLPEMQTRKELYELLGYEPGTQWNFDRRE
jgi:methylisocitrate lyase